MTTESESRMREVLDRIFDYGIDRSILKAPCMFCGYKGEGYWQRGTHDERCPWRYVGGEFDRDQKLRDVVLSPPARRTSYEWEDEDGFRYRVVWDEAIGCWASQAQEEDDYNGVALWVHRNGGPEAQAIATLAGLEKPEEKG